MNNDKIKVLFVAGWGRSGSTMLDTILGQIDGFFSVGELRYIWDRGIIENRCCGCGTPFLECELWSGILEEAFGGVDQINANEMVRLRENVHTRHTLLSFLPWGRRLLSARLGQYTDRFEELYRAIQSRTSSRVIVDSSKFPSHGYALGAIPSIDLYTVHLIRDPRAVAFSWLRGKTYDRGEDGKPSYMPQQSPLRSSWLWSTWNITAEALWNRSRQRYLMLRYEDLIRRPQQSVKCILDLVQQKATRLPFVDEHKVELAANHAVSGNPSRFRTGTVELRPDEEWKGKMKQTHKAMITMLTWPLLRRYGYLGNTRNTHQLAMSSDPAGGNVAEA